MKIKLPLILSILLVFSQLPIYKSDNVQANNETSNLTTETENNIQGLEVRYYKKENFSDLILIRSEESDASYSLAEDITDFPSSIQSKLNSVESAMWKGQISPNYSESYTFNASSNQKVQLWINDQLILDGTDYEPQSISLEKGMYYDIVLKTVSSSPEIQLKWTSPSQEEEVIPLENLFPSIDGSPDEIGEAPSSSDITINEQVPLNDQVFSFSVFDESARVEISETPETLAASSLSIVPSNDVDTDADGVPDTWEMLGYTFIAGYGVLEWNDEYETYFNAEKFITSPTDWSTDQDPYSDKEEVTGQVDQAIVSPADHPLIPAFPEMQVELTSIDFTPNGEITFEDGSSRSSGWSSSVDRTTGTITSDSYTNSVSATGGFSMEEGWKAEVTASHEWTGSTERHNLTQKSISKDGSEEKSWQTATTTDPTKAAKVSLNVKYSNIGTAPIYDLIPTLSFSVLDTTALTFNPQIEVNSLAANGIYPSASSIAVQYDESGNDLYVTEDQLKLIEMGYPINLHANQFDGKVKRLDKGQPLLEYDWSWYEAAIDNETAEIVFMDGDEVKTYRVFARDSEGMNSQYKPTLTIADALTYALDAEVREVNGENTFYLDGQQVDSDWSFYVSSEDSSIVLDETNFYDMELSPDMTISILDPNEDASSIVNYSMYADGGKSIKAGIWDNGYPIESVTATVKTLAGEKKIVELTDEDRDQIYESTFSLPVDTAYSDAKIQVKNVKGNITEHLILESQKDPFSNEPLGYVPLDSKKEFTDFKDLGNTYPNAEAFVIEVSGEFHNATDSITFGNFTTHLGVTHDYQDETTLDLFDKYYPKEFAKQSYTMVVPKTSNMESEYEAINRYYYYDPYDSECDSPWAVACFAGEKDDEVRELNHLVNTYLVGYYTTSDEAGHFTPSYMYKEIAGEETRSSTLNTGKDSRSSTLNTGKDNASGYLFRVKAKNVVSDDVRVTLNGVTAKLGTSASENGGSSIGVQHLPIQSKDVIFVPADELSPNTVSIEISRGEWSITRYGSINVDFGTYTIEMIGYFQNASSSNEDYAYQPLFEPVPLSHPDLSGSNVKDTSGTIELENDRFAFSPKGYLVNVTAKNMGSDHIGFSLNNSLVAKLGTSSTVNFNGTVPEKINHSTLMYVPANSDPYAFNFIGQVGSWSSYDDTSEFMVEIVGYFYQP
ncbi:PA14 domain-containing protein [Bacillus carboniphilus]|uniref:PA14 domain-containing protein n=1 Tax=Bacillus carboniphilus TaxID=86663 RepID=A0ABY9JXK5_9BACI|nr:binary toxin-like calcium binding domain-containing protein [Bacillus carboniphilus]WLR43243.1 PA14 domain-containing protein [Bacillus carboniphilus]